MAHNLEIINGVASYAENGRKERAWHKLGKVFDGPMTVIEAIEASRANYEVALQPVFMMSPAIADAMARGENIPSDLILESMIPDRKATMRADNGAYLGTVSNSYGVVQNADAFKFIDTLLTGQLGNAVPPVIESAGVLGHGERIFITAKFPDNIILDNKGNDLVEMYVVFTTSHDGTGAVNVMVTPTRVVCNNTLNYAMKHNSGKMYFKHTSGVMSRLDLVQKENAEIAYRTLNLYEVYSRSLKENFEQLRRIKLGDKMIEKVLANSLLSDGNLKIYQETGNIWHDDISTRGRNLVNSVWNSIQSGVGQEYGEKGTALWVMNGITSYYQNAAVYKDEERKFDSIMNGVVKNNVQKALECVLEVA